MFFEGCLPKVLPRPVRNVLLRIANVAMVRLRGNTTQKNYVQLFMTEVPII